jgi:autotransporter-associated beta strand protein
VDNAFPNPAPYTDLTLGATGETSGTVNTLDLLGHSQTVASLNTVANGTNQIISSNGSATTPAIGSAASASTGHLTVNVASGTDSYAGLLGDSNGTRLANNFSLTKSGTGTLALTRATGNTYSGGTVVSSGTLVVSNTSGSATGSGALTVNGGATLAGNGTINSTTNTVSGNVTVGSGGSNTTDVLTMTASSSTDFSGANLTFNLDANSTNSNTVALGGTPTILFGSGVTTLTLNLLGTGSTNIADGTRYILFAATSGVQYADLSIVGGKITNFVLNLTGTATNGQANSVYYQNSFLVLNGGNIEIQVVPEPGTWALMLGGLVLLVVFQRVRRNRLG